jgi:O-antigen ligase
MALLLLGAVLFSPAGGKLQGVTFWVLALVCCGLFAGQIRRGDVDLLLVPHLLLTTLAAHWLLFFNFGWYASGLVGARSINTVSWFAFVPLLVVLWKVTELEVYLARALVLGAVVMLVISAIQVFFLGLDRATPAGVNILIYAQGSVFAAAFALGMAFLFKHKTANSQPALFSTGWLLTACLLWLANAALAGYRTLGAVIPIFLVVGYSVWSRQSKQAALGNHRWIGVVLFGALLSGLMFSPFRERLGSMQAEWNAWLQEPGTASPLGERLNMWLQVVYNAGKVSFWGLGPDSFAELLRAQQISGGYPSTAPLYHHPHNTFFAVFVEYGVAGLCGLAFFVVWLLRLAFTCSIRFGQVTCFAAAVVAIVASFNSLFAHQATHRQLVLLLALWISIGLRERAGLSRLTDNRM